MDKASIDLTRTEPSTMKQPLLSFDIVKRFAGFTLECKAAFDSGVTAIFGPSGSGKSTLLNCIAGLINPDAGEIEVMEQSIFSSRNRNNVPPEKRRIGYVFQDSTLFPHFNVRQNIMFGYNLTPAERRETEPDQLVELLHLSHLMERRVANLSGGERQRVALARALATSPRLLLLDEPLASLDGGFRGIIIGYLKQITRELGTPMVYVSHSISEVMALAESTLVLLDGKPVVYGKTTQVLANAEVAGIGDYANLENILDATVIRPQSEGGLTEIEIGDVRLVSPEVNRPAGEVVQVSIRAGDIILTLDVPSKISARNIIRGVVTEIHELGPRVLVYTDVGERIVVEITQPALRDLGLHVGSNVHLIIKTNSIVVLDAPDYSHDAS